MIKLAARYEARAQSTAVEFPFVVARALARAGGEIEARALARIDNGEIVTEASILAEIADAKPAAVEVEDGGPEAELFKMLDKADRAFSAAGNSVFALQEIYDELSVEAQTRINDLARRLIEDARALRAWAAAGRAKPPGVEILAPTEQVAAAITPPVEPHTAVAVTKPTKVKTPKEATPSKPAKTTKPRKEQRIVVAKGSDIVKLDSFKMGELRELPPGTKCIEDSGLMTFTEPDDAHVWAVMVKTKGLPLCVRLGHAKEMFLAEARKMMDLARDAAKAGHDPQAAVNAAWAARLAEKAQVAE